MRRYPYKKVNAFTGGLSQGNPAAYLMLAEDVLTEQELLQIGKEHAGFVSEVVFCSNSDKADYKLTYYSSECEVDFCGHGTIATMYDLIQNNKVLRQKEKIIVETNRKGIITVYNHINTEDAIYITAPDALHLQVPVMKDQIAAALELSEEAISSLYPVDFIDGGLRTLIVPIEAYATEITVYPDQEKLKRFCLENGMDIILLFSKEASSKEFVAHTRVFAPKFGYLEDPATGSGNSAFGYYMLKNKMWDGEPISLEQGGDNIAFNTVKLKTAGEAVLFGGRATTRIDGFFLVEK